MTKGEIQKITNPEQQEDNLTPLFNLSHPGVFHNSLLLVLQSIDSSLKGIEITLNDLKKLLEKPNEAKELIN